MSMPPKPPGEGPTPAGPPDAGAGPDEGVHVPAAEGLQSLLADRHHRVQVAAYYLAERRGFAPGHELDDWLAAEEAVEAEDAARWSED